MDQLDAAPIGRGAFARLHVQCDVEIVDDDQQLAEQVEHRLVGLRAALALDALAIVVELGRLAHPAVVVVIAFALQIRSRIGRNDRVRAPGAFCRGILNLFLSHKT